MVETGISLIVVIVISLFITSLICLILKGLKRFERNMISKIFLCVLYLLSIYLLLFKPYIYNGFGRVSKDMSITNLSLKPFSTIEMYLENKKPYLNQEVKITDRAKDLFSNNSHI